MNIKFYPTHLIELPSPDMITAYDRILSTIEKEMPNEAEDNQMITFALNKIKDNHMPLLNRIVKRRGGHELTAVVNEYHKQRIDVLKSIRCMIKAQLTSIHPEMREAAKMVQSWFDLHSDVLPYGSQDAVTKSIDELEIHINSKENFKHAIEKVVTESFLNDLWHVNNKYTKVKLERLMKWGEEDVLKVDAPVVKRKAVKDLNSLINLIEMMHKWEKGTYDKLCTNLEFELKRVRALYLRARTVRKNKKSLESAVKEIDINNEDIYSADINNVPKEPDIVSKLNTSNSKTNSVEPSDIISGITNPVIRQREKAYADAVSNIDTHNDLKLNTKVPNSIDSTIKPENIITDNMPPNKKKEVV